MSREQFSCMTLDCNGKTSSPALLFCRLCRLWRPVEGEPTQAERDRASAAEYQRMQDENERLENEDRPPDFWRGPVGG